MNESYPAAETPLPYYDRSTGLLIFGVLTILLGGLCGLFVPLMLVGRVMAATIPNAPEQPPLSAFLPGLFMYAGMAVALVWLGIGSIQAKRWARALLLIFSWSWLVVGVIEVVAFAFIMPKIMANLPTMAQPGHRPLPAGAMDGVLFFMFIFLGIFFIIMPGIWTFFYSSRHVKCTCEWRNPAASWTDACPLPVLAMVLWLLFAVPMMLAMALGGHAVMPFFGMFLTGVTGALFCLIVAAVWSFAAWLVYRLDVRGWWLILIALCLYAVSAFITFSQHDILELYRLMDYPDAQIEQIKKLGMFEGNGMLWMTVLGMLPFLGFLFFIKRYFRPKV